MPSQDLLFKAQGSILCSGMCHRKCFQSPAGYTIQWHKQSARPSYIRKMSIHLAYLIAVRFTFMENPCSNVHGQVYLSIPRLDLFPDGLRYHGLIKLEIIHPYIASPDQSVSFNPSSLIYLLVVLMFFSGKNLGCMSIYVMNFYNYILSNNFLCCSGPDGSASILQSFHFHSCNYNYRTFATIHESVWR